MNSEELDLIASHVENKGITNLQEFLDDHNDALKKIKKLNIWESNQKMHNHLANKGNLTNKKALFYTMRA